MSEIGKLKKEIATLEEERRKNCDEIGTFYEKVSLLANKCLKSNYT
jgi:hypothetical protein